MSQDITSEDVSMKAAGDSDEQSSEKFDKILGIVHSTAWAWFIAVLIFVSLFLSDLNVAVFPKSADIVIMIIYIIIGAVFLAEFIILCVYQEGYARADSIFFWSDLLSLLSMAIDCVPVDVYAGQPENSVNTVDKIVNAIKILRLFRLWRIFRILKLIEIYTTNKFTYAYKLGASLSTFLTMKLGVVIIFITALVTVLKWDYNWIGPPMGLNILLDMVIFSNDFNVTQAIFVKYYPILSIKIDNITTYTKPGVILDSFREIETELFTTRRAKMIMDVTGNTRPAAWVNIINILIILIFFILIVFIIRNDSDTKFKSTFDHILTNIEEVAKKMKIKKNSDDKFKEPKRYYDTLLTQMRDRVKNITLKKSQNKKKKKI